MYIGISPTLVTIIAISLSIVLFLYVYLRAWNFLICIIPIALMLIINYYALDFSNPEHLIKTFYGNLRGDFSRTPEEMSYYFVDAQAIGNSEAALAIYNPAIYCTIWQGEPACTRRIYGNDPEVKHLETDANTAVLEITGTLEPQSIMAGSVAVTTLHEFGEIPFHHRVVVRKVGDQWRIAGIETMPSDVISVVLSFREAMNTGDVDAALALFADDANLNAIQYSGGRYYGKEQIRDWLEFQVSQGTRVELIDLLAFEDTVWWVNSGLQGHPSIETVVRNGKIQTFSIR